jgi:hypothetical protein
MALTDNCDFYISVDEVGINRVARHIYLQRPSLFHYGTLHFVEHPESLCHRIEFHPEVVRRKNPLLTREDLFEVPGTGGMYGLEFCMQFVRFVLDFHPGNAVALPPELNPPLATQHLALAATVVGGFGCPNPKRLPIYSLKAGHSSDLRETTSSEKEPLPIDHLHCFSLDLNAVLHVERANIGGDEYLCPILDGLEVVDISPPGLEGSLECVLGTTLRLALLPKLRIAVKDIAFEIADSFQLVLAPISPAVPNNPSIDGDQISILFNLEDV